MCEKEKTIASCNFPGAACCGLKDVYTNLHMYIYIYIHTLCIYIYINVNVYVYMYIYIYMTQCVCMYISQNNYYCNKYK